MIVMDLDDTLLNRSKEVSAANSDAIQKCIQQGVRFVIATARPFDALKHLLPGWLIERSWKVCHNGAQLYDEKGEIQFTNDIDEGLFGEMMDWIFTKDNETKMSWYSQSRWFTHTVMDDQSKRAYGIPLEAENFPLPKHCPYADHSVGRIEKILLPHFSLYHEFKTVFSHKVSIIRTKDKSLTMLMAKNVDKSNMINELCQRYEIGAAEVMVFGDDHNDLELFKTYPHCVAMGNALEELKNRAWYITKDNNHTDSISSVLSMISDQMTERVV